MATLATALSFELSRIERSAQSVKAEDTSSTSLVPNFTDINSTTSQSAVLDPQLRLQLVILFSVLTVLGFIMNGLLLAYIIVNRLYRSFVSSHFIAHLALTNMLGCGYLLPVFISCLSGPESAVRLFGDIDQATVLCRIQAFVTCAIWAVIFYMTTCVAGVHLLTFARIHYEELFGLPPSVICLLSWVIGFALGLPCLTNTDIVRYDENFYLCAWQTSSNGYKFLSYMALLGVLLPLILTFYAYFRVLGIFYHSPVVFQALGLYKSRFLVYGLLLVPLCQISSYVLRFYQGITKNQITETKAIAYPIVTFLAYIMCIVDPALYGASLFLMKEEDMTLTTRSHKATTYTAPGALPPQEL